MTRVMFKNIMTKALEDQKSLADATSTEAIKVAFTEGVKHGSDMQAQTLHSSSMEPETLRQNPIKPSVGYELNAVNLLRPATCNAPSVVNNAIPV